MDKTAVVIAGIIAAGFLGVIAMIAVPFHIQTIAAFEHGYCAVMLPGNTTTQWAKCPDPK